MAHDACTTDQPDPAAIRARRTNRPSRRTPVGAHLHHLSTDARAFVRALELLHRESTTELVEMLVPARVEDAELIDIMHTLRERHGEVSLHMTPDRHRFICL